MPDDTPPLDLDTYDGVKASLQALIPRYTPEWTDWNESDPGTTLLELFAWLAQSVAYRINQVPGALSAKLLELVGIRPRPARPATAYLTFTADPAAAVDDVVVPASTVVSAAGDDGRPVYFETDTGLGVTRFPLRALQVFDGTTQPVAGSFAPFGDSPTAGNAVYLGFGPVDPAASPRPAFPAQIRLRVTAVAAAGAARADRDAGARPAPPVTVQWEYPVTAGPAPTWARLRVSDDGSVAFTRTGDILVEGPARPAVLPALGAVDTPHHWLRCRLLSGVYPGPAPVVESIEANTVGATGLRTVTGELVGSSGGLPDQRFALANPLVDPASVLLTVTPGFTGPWTRIDDVMLAVAGATDRVFVLDAAAGAVRFGDGAHGLIPPAGCDITATYRFGGGVRGNVAAGAATGLLGPLTGVASVTNPRPAVGGQDLQSAADLARQAPAMLRSQQRAVTAADLVQAAVGVPGIARATAVPLAHPDLPGVEVPGAVTVVVVPTPTPVTGPRVPMPSPELKGAVAALLAEQRPITAEVYVAGPRYLEVSVRARIEIRPAASVDATREAVRAALGSFLSPVPGSGTPLGFGADFHPTSVFRTILDVPDVVAVPILDVTVAGQTYRAGTEPDTITLGAGELVAEAADGHVLTVVAVPS